MKRCPQCNTEKKPSGFYASKTGDDGLYRICKDCARANSILYNGTQKGKEARDAYRKTPEDIERRRVYGLSYRAKLGPGGRRGEYEGREAKDKRNAYVRARRASVPHYRIRRNVSTAVAMALADFGGGKRGKAVFVALRYTPQDLRDHLESLWEPWMSWDNYGNVAGCWVIDHIIPQADFHYTSLDDKDFFLCWQLRNLRPLECIANIKKGRKREGVCNAD